MKKYMMAFLTIGLVLTGWGCSQRVTDFTVISTKNVRVDGEEGDRVKGEDMKLNCLVNAGLAFPDMKAAIDQAIEAGGGDALVDGVVYYKQGLMTQGYEVEGTIINTKGK